LWLSAVQSRGEEVKKAQEPLMTPLSVSFWDHGPKIRPQEEAASALAAMVAVIAS